MTTDTPASGLLRREHAAEYLGISVRTLHELMRLGELTSVGIPSRTGKRPGRRFERAELDRFIERHRSDA